MKKVRILIADDHDVVRAGVRLLIETQPGWDVCGEAANGREAVALADKLRPDLVVLDITMPELNGLEAARQIKKVSPQIELLMLTAHESEDLIHQVFDVGARSYILKSEAGKHLVAAIQSACEHKPYFTSKVSQVVFARYLRGKSPDSESGTVTARERELLQLLAEGKSNKEAASQLGISVKTVETHRAAIMRKLALKSVSDLVRYAIRNKIIEA